MKLLFHNKKNQRGFNLKNNQGNISINRIEVCTIGLTLNLLLSPVVLTGMTTHNFKTMDSSIMGYCIQTPLFLNPRSSLKDLISNSS